MPNPPTLYKAPHTRTNITSRANEENGSLQTYSRIPLHLRKDTNDTKTTISQTTVQSSTSTVHNDKANVDKIIAQTCIGRTIHTPVRFVQLVHVVIAHNDIYSRTSCTHISGGLVDQSYLRGSLPVAVSTISRFLIYVVT